MSTVVGRNGFSGIVTAQNQFQPIVFICLVLPTNATISQCYVIFNNMTTGPICLMYVTEQNQLQPIFFICVGFSYKCYHITVLCDI